QTQAETPPPEPPMVGSADRIWAKLEIKPKPGPRDADGKAQTMAQGGSTKESAARRPPDPKPPADNGESEELGQRPVMAVEKARTVEGDTSLPRTTSAGRGLNGSNAEIRKVWMWGSVSLHQDPEQGKSKGQDASGEALYLDNRGKGKIITEIYQREPNEKTYLPGPLPPALVENEDLKITAAGKLRMDQATDQAEVEGPGTLTQVSAKPLTAPANGVQTSGGPATAGVSSSGDGKSYFGTEGGAELAQNSPDASVGQGAPKGLATASKTRTRAGRPVSGQATTTVAFSEPMELL